MQKFKVEVNLNEADQGLILTIADREILNGNELNDDDDILENVDIKERDQLEFRKKMQEKVKKQHSKYDCDEYGNPQTLLEKYDEQKIQKEGFYLDGQGSVIENNKKQLELISSKLNKQSNNQYSLQYEDQIASDYKPNIPNTFIKKKFKKQNDTNFQEKQESIHTDKFNEHLIEEDDYELLQKSIQNKIRQKLCEKQQAQNQSVDFIAQNYAMEEENQLKQNEDFIKPNPKFVTGEITEIKVISNSTDFLSNVRTEKQLEEIRIGSTYSIKDASNGTASIVNVQLPTEKYKLQKQKQKQQEEQLTKNNNDNDNNNKNGNDDIIDVDLNNLEKNKKDDEQNQDNDQEDQLYIVEDKHTQGLAATLKILRERGELKAQTYDFVGRNKDQKRFSDLEQKDNEIQLEYRDSSGRLMTPKEAFRYQCWKFHGEGPSKNKIEKRKRKDLMIQKQKLLKVGETPLMKVLREQQKSKDSNYMIIGKKKCIEQ